MSLSGFLVMWVSVLEAYNWLERRLESLVLEKSGERCVNGVEEVPGAFGPLTEVEA